MIMPIMRKQRRINTTITPEFLERLRNEPKSPYFGKTREQILEKRLIDMYGPKFKLDIAEKPINTGRTVFFQLMIRDSELWAKKHFNIEPFYSEQDNPYQNGRIIGSKLVRITNKDNLVEYALLLPEEQNGRITLPLLVSDKRDVKEMESYFPKKTKNNCCWGRFNSKIIS